MSFRMSFTYSKKKEKRKQFETVDKNELMMMEWMIGMKVRRLITVCFGVKVSLRHFPFLFLLKENREKECV